MSTLDSHFVYRIYLPTGASVAQTSVCAEAVGCGIGVVVFPGTVLLCGVGCRVGVVVFPGSVPLGGVTVVWG